MKIYKELAELWDWVGFCLWVGNYRKANETFDLISKKSKGHKVANFFASIFYPFYNL